MARARSTEAWGWAPICSTRRQKSNDAGTVLNMTKVGVESPSEVPRTDFERVLGEKEPKMTS